MTSFAKNKGSLPDAWQVVELNTLCDLQNGYAFKSQDYVSFSNTLSCRMSNIRPDGTFDLDYNSKFLPDSYVEQYKQYLLRDGDVVIAMTDMATETKILGVPTIVITGGRKVLLNQRVGKLVIRKPGSIHFPYLKYVLNRAQVRRYYLRFAGGGVQVNLGKKDLLSVKIPLPPLDEQHRIAAILDKADAVRRKRQQAIALTEELLRSAFLEMFDTSVAKSWEMATVEQLLASKTGAIRTGPFGSQLLHSEFTSRGIAVLGIDNVVQNQFRWVQLRFISEKKYEQLKRYTVRPGDVLISIMGTCGRCAIVPDDCPKAINTKHLCCITLNCNKCYPEFLQSYFLIHPQASNYLKKNAKGAIMEGLNMSIIKDLPVPLVPIELQKQYVNLQHQIIRSKISAIESRHEADNLFNSLLQKAFRGEL